MIYCPITNENYSVEIYWKISTYEGRLRIYFQTTNKMIVWTILLMKKCKNCQCIINIGSQLNFVTPSVMTEVWNYWLQFNFRINWLNYHESNLHKLFTPMKCKIALILKQALICWYADKCRSAKDLFTFENLNFKKKYQLL